MFSKVLTEAENELLLATSDFFPRLLQWGTGLSTLALLRHRYADPDFHMLTVEGSPEVARDCCLMQSEILNAIHDAKLEFLLQDSAGTTADTDPGERNFLEVGTRYVLRPLDHADMWHEFNPEDVCVFIAGRFRVACALNALLVGYRKIVIHDFLTLPHREEILKYATVVAAADSLFVLEPNDTSIRELRDSQHGFDYLKDPR